MEALLADLREMLHARSHVVKDTIAVRFMDFGDSALEIPIYGEISLAAWPSYLQEREAINLAIMRILAGHGISVAFPSRSIYLESVPSASRGLTALDSQE